MRKILIVLAPLLLALAGCSSFATMDDHVTSSEYVPPAGRGRVVIVLSGTSGPVHYTFIARELAAQGYYAILHDAKDFRPGDAYGDEDLRQVIIEAQRSPHALPGKVGVVGFSLGGASVLAHASTQPDVVAVAVAYYPGTADIPAHANVIRHWAVPTVALAGEADGCQNCKIETIRAMATSAKDQGAPFELVTYAGVGHGFNLPIGTYQKAAADDAWQRTLAALHQYRGT